MSIAIQCTTCGLKLMAPPEAVGGKVRCSSCKTILSVPNGAEPVMPVAVRELEEKSKNCPFCGESVKATAMKCRHCGETIDVALRSAEEARKLIERQSGSPQGPMVFMNAGGGGASSSSAAASSSTGSSAGGEDRSLRGILIQRLGGGGKSFASWHVFHLILTLLTCGLWLPLWILHFVIWNSTK